MDGSCGSTDFEVKPELRTPPHPAPFRSRSANLPANLKNSGISEEAKKGDETLLQPVKKRVPLDYHLLEFFDKQTCSPGLGMQRKGNSGMVTPNRPNSGNSDYANSPNENGEIKWSIEELSALKPVHFTAEDIARSTFSPDPALDAMIQAKLDVYWKTNRPFIPSPEVSSSSSDHNMMNLPNMNFTPSSSGIPLRDFIRSREAFKVGNPIFSSSPVQRPRRASLTYKRMRNASVQTACTIPPSFDFDFEKILGQSCVYEPPENETDEEEFNVSLDASIGRRKLFLDDEVQPAEAPGNGTSVAEPENDDEPPIHHIINLDDAEDMLSAVLGAQTESTSTSKMDFEGHLTMEVGMTSHESFDYKMLAACPLSPIINKSQSAEDEE